MKAIIEDLNNIIYNLNLTKEQIELVEWMADRRIIYDVRAIDKMKWEDIE